MPATHTAPTPPTTGRRARRHANASRTSTKHTPPHHPPATHTHQHAQHAHTQSKCCAPPPPPPPTLAPALAACLLCLSPPHIITPHHANLSHARAPALAAEPHAHANHPKHNHPTQPVRDPKPTHAPTRPCPPPNRHHLVPAARPHPPGTSRTTRRSDRARPNAATRDAPRRAKNQPSHSSLNIDPTQCTQRKRHFPDHARTPAHPPAGNSQPAPDTTTTLPTPSSPLGLRSAIVARHARRAASSTPHGHHPPKSTNKQTAHDDAAAPRATHQPIRAVTCPPPTPPDRHPPPAGAPAATPTRAAHQQNKHRPTAQHQNRPRTVRTQTVNMLRAARPCTPTARPLLVAPVARTHHHTPTRKPIPRTRARTRCRATRARHPP